MRQRIVSFISMITLIAGLSLLFYPTLSNYMQNVKHRNAIYNYLESVETLSDDEYEQVLADAEAYNTRLAEGPIELLKLTDAQLREYYDLLDITGTGIMGYIDIQKANIHLPIYHGVSETVLQIGVGHLDGSSLPVGGETSHCILSGHRGLPSAKLFTNLDKLEIGDTFTITVLNEVYVYKVDDVSIIKPTETESLVFSPGHDYCTLITCTPYGINTHRMLVRGERVEISPEEEKLMIQSGAKYIDIWLILAAIEIPVLIISVIISASAERRRSHKTNQRR